MPAKHAIYLDSNASAALHPNARRALLEILSENNVVLEGESLLLPNPSSIHSHGRQSKRWIADAREAIAASLGASTDPEQLVITSSGSEANQLAIRSVLEPLLARGQRPHWITTRVEHDSTLQMTEWLKSRGGSVSYIPVNSHGQVQADCLESLIRPETALVSLVWVNNETGVVTDFAPIVTQAKSHKIRIHLDGAQAWGKIPIDLPLIGADYVCFSAHKIGGLAGTGVLWVARGVPVEPILLGKQEKGRRAGTENVLGIVAAGAAAQSIDPIGWASKLTPLRERFEQLILETIPGAHINGLGTQRVANTINLSFDGVEGDGLVMALDLAGYSVSSGSACSSGVLEPSHVLMAMGYNREQAMAAVRVSISSETSWNSLESFAKSLAEIVSRVRESKGWQMSAPSSLGIKALVSDPSERLKQLSLK